MGVYLVPPIGAGVWVEFEQGDPDHPIWVGCRWGATADVPSIAHAGLAVSPSIVLQTAGQNCVVISDVPGPAGGIMLRCGGSTLMVDPDRHRARSRRRSRSPSAKINLLGVTDINQGASEGDVMPGFHPSPGRGRDLRACGHGAACRVQSARDGLRPADRDDAERLHDRRLHLSGDASGAPPCATAQWTTAATRVTAMGQPVLLQDSQATCVPTGTPLSSSPRSRASRRCEVRR